MDIHEKFEQVDDDYLKFDLIENKLSTRPDIHAFILLDEIFPDKRDMVCAAGHDIIWLDVEYEQLEALSDDQILELTRCGVRHDKESGLLSMFT
jgi:hypothetical protein